MSTTQIYCPLRGTTGRVKSRRPLTLGIVYKQFLIFLQQNALCLNWSLVIFAMSPRCIINTTDHGLANLLTGLFINVYGKKITKVYQIFQRFM